MYVLIPLGIISTALASSTQKGHLKQWKVFLVVLAGTIVYTIGHFLLQYMKDQDYDFFQCNQGMRIWDDKPYNMTSLPSQGFDNAIQHCLILNFGRP